MRVAHLPLLVCPESFRPLQLAVQERGAGDRVKTGVLIEPISGKRYPIKGYIPRFVPEVNYATSFGYQWHLHRDTQQDEYVGVAGSAKRFLEETRWGSSLEGQVILEVGCGAGRFTRHALSTGATVISLDYSNAVEANYQVNGANERLLVVQADVYAMPVRKAFVDAAFCFGVLQHTPDPKRSFESIVAHVNSGGRVAVDVYLKSWKSHVHVKPYMRALVRGWPSERLYRFTVRWVNVFWPVARLLRGSKLGRTAIGRFIAERSEQLPGASDDLIKEWAYLDTFDWFSPTYDFPQTLGQFRSWFEAAGLAEIDVQYGYNGIEGRAVKP
jgi:SAM-dependent methyltransferase